MINPFSKSLCSPNQIEGIGLDQLVSGILILNELETSVLFLLFENKLSAVEISKRTRKHRSTIQKALSTLMGKGLIIRKKKGLRRGYHYTYSAIPKIKVKELMIRYINEQMNCLIDRINNEL